jgi:hypothetical protein
MQETIDPFIVMNRQDKDAVNIARAPKILFKENKE